MPAASTCATARFQDDPAPIDPSCACEACRNHSRAYLAHLFRARELLAYRLATLHNVTWTLNLLRRERLGRWTFAAAGDRELASPPLVRGVSAKRADGSRWSEPAAVSWPFVPRWRTPLMALVQERPAGRMTAYDIGVEWRIASHELSRGEA